MTDWETVSTELGRPLSSSSVKERTQAGRKLSYIEGWHAIAEANRIFGFGGWERSTVETKMVAQAERKIGKTNPRDGWGVSYIAKVRVTVGEVSRDGWGAGHGIDVDLGLAHESAIKEAETDAMKRALMTFGNPFGLALYDKEQANVSSEPDQAPAKPKMGLSASVHEPDERGPDDPFPEINGTAGKPKYKGGNNNAPSEYLFIEAAIRAQRSIDDLQDWGNDPVNQAAIAKLPAEWVPNIRNEFKERLLALKEAA
jgi:DNA recombination protein Rad52